MVDRAYGVGDEQTEACVLDESDARWRETRGVAVRWRGAGIETTQERWKWVAIQG